MKKLLGISAIILLGLISCGKPSVPNDAERAYFDAKGGEHTFSNGITIIVPPGALSGGRNIFIRDLHTNEMASLLKIRAIPEQNVLFAFVGGPDDIQFAASATVIIPVQRLERNMIPLIMHFDLGSLTASVANVSYKADPDAKTLSLSIDHFTGYEAEIKDEIHRNECTDPSNTSCRCGEIEVTQTDIHYSCSREDCQVVYSENIVRFLACGDPPPEESSIFEEVSPGCIPELAMEVEKVYIEPGEQCEVRALVRLGCAAPTGTVDVNFSAIGPGTISPLDDVTDNQGIAKTTVAAGSEEGKITVTAQADFTYYTKRINVNGQDLVSEQRTVHLTNSICVYVVNKPILELFAMDSTIATNDMTDIIATLSYNDTPVENEIVYFSVSGPATVDPISFSTVSGNAYTTLLSHNSEGTALVSARSDVAIMLPTGEMILYPVSDNISVIIAEENDLDGTVWRFESVIESTTLFNPQGCEDTYVQPACSCEGDYTGIMLTETTVQKVTGKFTLTRRTGSMSYTVAISDLKGLLIVNSPSSQYAKKCPLGGGLGVPGCACEDPDYIRIDAKGVDATSESVSFSSPAPGTDEIDAYAFVFDDSIVIDFNGPNEPEPVIEQRTWYSTYSDCGCIGWTGEKIYESYPHWGFERWGWEGNIENGQWLEVDQLYDTETRHTFSLECIANGN